jgi:hypothetical protein
VPPADRSPAEHPVTEAERLVREYVTAGDHRDDDALGRLLHPGVVTHSPGSRNTHRGHLVG